ncbi:DUF1835 domain-containing protein [Nisaea nitritireducens]|uniref:DUF1835 domain-containing protein n=1 Tax=Nisaea nitritireducens TaxID=568392 RepID=UPI0018674B64|nr:DUF1835 domain-containing protein [Nisaea nitritireducens]
MSEVNEPAMAGPRDYFGGRLNLEQQKKRAKELLKAVRDGDADAVARWQAHHPNGVASERLLADAQLVIARENGFPSWPRMKAHIDTLRIARQRMEAGRPLVPDSPDMVHIRCGEDIRHSLNVAGFAGAFAEFSDPYCQGPVPRLDRAAFLDKRSEFIVSAYDRPLKETRVKLEAEYDTVDAIGAGGRVTLWFEHDSYDQLILARLLANFSRLDARPDLQMICVGEVPGVQGFVGLGQLHPEVLLWLWENERKPVTEEQLALGAEVWGAITDPDPTSLARIARDGTPALPLMAPALLRHLRELPSVRTGLGMTQELALSILAEAEGQSLPAGRIFHALMTRHEPLPFLGDLMFWHVLKDLADSTEQVIEPDPETAGFPWPKRGYALTEAGQRVLAGELDRLGIAGAPRWVGGVEIQPRAPTWRWDEGRSTVVMT